MPDFTPTAARRWMLANLDAYFVEPGTGDVNATFLAEACAAAFGADDLGGPLDDEQHWIWEVALAVSEAWLR